MGGERRILKDCAPGAVLSMFDRLGGFVTKEGAKHTKVTHVATGKATTIPRHKRVNGHLLRDVIEDYLIRDLGFDEDTVYAALKC